MKISFVEMNVLNILKKKKNLLKVEIVCQIFLKEITSRVARNMSHENLFFTF